MTGRYLALLVAFGAVALSGCAELVFVHGHDSRSVIPQVYKMQADGTGQANLSQTESFSSFPDPSADGARIAFTSGTGIGAAAVNIYLMPASGGERSQLTAGAFQNWTPRWGLNEYANRIVYSATGASGTDKLYIVNTAGAAHLLTNPGPDFSDRFPDIYYSLAHNKYRIIFSRQHVTAGRARLFTIDADGTGEAEMVTKDRDDNEDMPVVSHDGRFVAYKAIPIMPDTFMEAVRVMSVDNWQRVSEFRLPVPNLINIAGIGWSRSDRRLYVAMESSEVTDVQFTEERREIFSMRPDGSDQRRLTNNKVPDSWPNGMPCRPRWRFLCSIFDSVSGE